MKAQKFTANLSRNQDRSSFSVIFNHPLKLDENGKPGRRVRKGLGTNDENEALKLVDELNILLSDESYWSPSMETKALNCFNPKVVKAFFDGLLPEITDSWEIRQKQLPIPTKDDGYIVVQLIGTTGAGKTTFLRQLIGTDPIKERFPSTSASKTTISDIEIIIDKNTGFSAVVSFISKEKTRQLIEESVIASIQSFIENKNRDEAERKLLEHNEQRFRLSYLLGTTKSLAPSVDILSDDDSEEQDYFEETAGASIVSEIERKVLLEKLATFLDTIQQIANDTVARTVDELDFDVNSASRQEVDAFNEIIEGQILENEGFDELVDTILLEVESKFDLIKSGSLVKTKGWGGSWTFESDNREDFIRTINRFSSNYAPSFGKLLTPLVDGIRVKGPFECSWASEESKLVLLDGEGLGHTPSSFSSISTSVTKKFNLADIILLVDNAAQPMQATPTLALREIVSGGYESKLAICFTHFDEVKGPNLLNTEMKRDHVYNSVENAIASIGKTLGKRAENSLKKVTGQATFYLSGIDQILTEKKKFTLNELSRMLLAFYQKVAPRDILAVHPVYDSANLIMAIKTALVEFHEPWRARLGLSRRSDITPIHWAKVKALTRRLGVLGEDEYDNLTPVADLIRLLKEHIYVFICQPVKFNSNFATEEQQNDSIALIANGIDSNLHKVIPEILFKSKVPSWNKAYTFGGKGSTYLRAQEIRSIYDISAPIPEEIPAIDANKFINELRELVKSVICEKQGLIN